MLRSLSRPYGTGICQSFKIYAKIGIPAAQPELTPQSAVDIVVPGKIDKISDILAAQPHRIQAAIAAFPLREAATFKMLDECRMASGKTKPRGLHETVLVIQKL